MNGNKEDTGDSKCIRHGKRIESDKDVTYGERGEGEQGGGEKEKDWQEETVQGQTNPEIKEDV